MRVQIIIITLALLVLLTGCTKNAQQQAVESAAQSEVTQEPSGDHVNTTRIPSNMPTELVLPEATITASTEVSDGYQLGFKVNQSQVEVDDLYRNLEGWTVNSQFETGDARSISLERDDHHVLVTITPKGTSRSEVLITGSIVKD